MKTSTLPPLRVEPELRESVEASLENGETISVFVERAVRSEVERRKHQREFIERGLASRAEAESTGEYYSHEEVMQGLDEIIAKAEARQKRK